jgi:phosphate-selective porin OprO and OprP
MSAKSALHGINATSERIPRKVAWMRTKPLRPYRDYHKFLLLVVVIHLLNSKALAQDPASTTTPALQSPAPTPVSVRADGKSPRSISKDLEERLKRMEESYQRMEDSNRQLQSKYDALLNKFDALTTAISRSESPVSRPPQTTRIEQIKATSDTPALPSPSPGPDGNLDLGAAIPLEALEESRVEDFISPYFQPPPDGAQGRIRRGSPSGGMSPVPLPSGESRMDQIGAGAQGTGGRTSPDQQPDTGSSPFGPSRTDSGDFPAGPSRMDRIGAGAEGTGGRTSPDQQPSARGARGEERRELQQSEGADQGPLRHGAKVEFAEGLEFTSDDGEFRLQFHNLTQAEYRGFPTHDQGVLQSQFFIPRERWYFTGDLTKYIGFYTVINRSYGSLDLLDAFININVDPKFNFRIGRMKTPYLYEYFSIAEGDLIAPERSLFAANLSMNRQIGAMLRGELLNNRLSYAVGAYNGPRNSFGDFNAAKDLIGIINSRPFLESEQFPALKYFNIGGSWDVGYQSNNNTPQPTFFETANDQTNGTGAIAVSPTFLHLNNNVVELGQRVQWGAHTVWFYKSLLLMAEYGGARAGYGFTNGTASTPVNFSGYHVTASYFLTGEQLTRRVNIVKPRRDFNFEFFKGGPFNPGAWEVYARFSTLDIGRNIFTGGFADPNLWTNHVWATDIGLNWYLNFYTRIFLDWQHAEFGNSVSVAPSHFSSTTDLFWLRFQIFF